MDIMLFEEIRSDLVFGRIGLDVGEGDLDGFFQNIAKGRLAKFFKEQTLEGQEYQMGDGKQTVKEAMKAADPEAKIVSFARFSLND